MNTTTAATPTERESRQWWAAIDGSVQSVTGYTCAPTNPGMWWCPQVRYSLSEGQSLFETEQEAIRAEIDRLNQKITAMHIQVSNLTQRLK